MGALKKLERVEGVGLRFFRARGQQVLNSHACFFSQAEPPANSTDGLNQQGKHSIHPGQQIRRNSDFSRPIFTRLGDHNLSYTGPQYKQGNGLQQIGSVFGSQSGTGTFFCSTKGFATTRGLVTEGDVGSDDFKFPNIFISEDDDFSDRISPGVLSSDEETGDGNIKQQKWRSMSGVNTQQGDEDDVDLSDADDEADSFKATSPLDIASNSLGEGTGAQKRPLWMRLEGSAGVKKASVAAVLDEWASEGHPLTKGDLITAITILRKRGKYLRCLEVSNWVMSEKPYELDDMDYGIRVQLISRVQNLQKAAAYFATIPKQFQTSMVYTILLTAYVAENKEKEAVNLIKKAEQLKLGHMPYMYNQLLYLYKKNGLLSGVAQVLQAMDEKHIEPDIFTYNIILDIRARKGDADGMEKVWLSAKGDKTIEPDMATFAILAKGYMRAGLQKKAEEVVKQVEMSPLQGKWVTLLRLYGLMGSEEDLERIWGLITQEQKLGVRYYLSMIRSLGKVGNSDRAEDIFKEMQDSIKDLNLRHYNALLSVYAAVGRAQKGERLVKQMARARLNPNPATYHELVGMYLRAGQEAKGMEALWKAQGTSRIFRKQRPMYSTYQLALEWFAEKGDVNNAEKVVRGLKLVGYTCGYPSYVVLLKAYKRGRMTPYGIVDRLQSDNLVPNQLIKKELKKLGGT